MRVNALELEKAAAQVLISLGEEPNAAVAVAECLVYADMTGVSTHGTYLLKMVCDRVAAKMLNIPTNARIIRESAGTALVDGNNGLGPAVATLAMETAIEKAKACGIGLALVRDTNNVGCLGYYTNLAAKRGMIGAMAGKANAAMAPWGGAEAYFGTNPISLSVPSASSAPVVLDMASSLVARGKIRKASREKKQIPPGWAIDSEGRSTTDPDAALKGTLLPMGGPKGSGLAIIVDMVTGILAGAKSGPAVKSFHSLDGATGVGCMCAALDPSKFMDTHEFEGQVRDYIADMKGMRLAEGSTGIFAPGEIEAGKWEKSSKNGIEMDDAAVATINELLKKAGSDMILGG